MGLHSNWEGFLKLNLLSIPVKAYTASISASHISFHQIHAGCGSRIRHQKVCPVHGEVTKDEVVSGYELTKGKYVIIEPDELAKLRKEDEKTITIDVFVPSGTIDPIYFSGRSFYLTADGKVGQKPYEVIQRVMTEQKREAVAKVVVAGREDLALVRPIEKSIVMTILKYADEVKNPSAFQDECPNTKPSRAELDMAENLVEASTVEEIDLSAYHDEYEADVAKLIEAKSKGKKIVPRRAAPAPAVSNLMDALRQSLKQAHARGKKTQTGRAKKRKVG